MFSGSRVTQVLAPVAALVLVVLASGASPAYATRVGSTSADSDHGKSMTAGANAQGKSAAAHGKSAAAHGKSTSAGAPASSGDTSSPQPVSQADSNGGGANGQCPGGPYCSTRDGSASQNGSGNGQAKGKPCAGCVGKADNKNPQGQKPNGSDHNKGYECDDNNGVGKTNPAHTGCKSTGQETPPPGGETTPPGQETPPPGGETTPPGQQTTPPPVSATELPSPPTPSANVVARPGPSLTPTGSLPNTGAGDGLAILLISGGGLLLAGGLVMAVRGRARG